MLSSIDPIRDIVQTNQNHGWKIHASRQEGDEKEEKNENPLASNLREVLSSRIIRSIMANIDLHREMLSSSIERINLVAISILTLLSRGSYPFLEGSILKGSRTWKNVRSLDSQFDRLAIQSFRDPSLRRRCEIRSI